MDNELRAALTGKIDSARLLMEALERLVGDDAAALGVIAVIQEQLTEVADRLEPGDAIYPPSDGSRKTETVAI